MTVKEVIEELKKYPQDCEVSFMSDSSDIGYVEEIKMCKTNDFLGVDIVVLKEL